MTAQVVHPTATRPGGLLAEHVGYELTIHLEGGHTLTGTLQSLAGNPHLWALVEDAAPAQEDDEVRYAGRPPARTIFAARSVVAFTIEAG